MPALSPDPTHRTSAIVTGPLFDHRLWADRRDRAARFGVETFLYDRAFEDCLERLDDIHHDFSQVLLAGCPNPDWPKRLAPRSVTVIEPGRVMASRAGGQVADLETLPFDDGQFDLCISVGILETADNLPLAAAALHFLLNNGGLLIGAIAGGDSLPRLRKAMLAADAVTGQASPHVHPRIEPQALAQLLIQAGFAMPVVDLDRVEIGYESLDSLVRDLRAMGATNILSGRSRRPIVRAGLDAARAAFLDGSDRVTERIDILHFAAWKLD